MLTRRLFLTSLLAAPAVAAGVRLPVYRPLARGRALFDLICADLKRGAQEMSRMLNKAIYQAGDLCIITGPPAGTPPGVFQGSPTFTPRYYEVPVVLEEV